MQLISEYLSKLDAEDARQKLRKRGIFTFVSSARSYSLSSYFTGALKVGLWAVFDNQYNDACRILAGKQCKVRHPLSEDQMVEMEILSKQRSPSLILKGLVAALVVTSIAVLAIVFFMKQTGAV